MVRVSSKVAITLYRKHSEFGVAHAVGNKNHKCGKATVELQAILTDREYLSES